MRETVSIQCSCGRNTSLPSDNVFPGEMSNVIVKGASLLKYLTQKCWLFEVLRFHIFLGEAHAESLFSRLLLRCVCLMSHLGSGFLLRVARGQHCSPQVGQRPSCQVPARPVYGCPLLCPLCVHGSSLCHREFCQSTPPDMLCVSLASRKVLDT